MTKTYNISVQDQMNADIIVDAIFRWERYDRIADSHCGLTNQAIEMRRKADLCWIAVRDLIAKSNNATIYAASKKSSCVWSAVNQNRKTK